MKKTVEEKIDELKGKGFSDYDDVAKEWREALGRIEFDKAYANLKNTKDVIALANQRIRNVEERLKTERKISTEDREYLLGVRDTLSALADWLDPKDYDARRRSIEAEVDRNLA